MSESKQQQELNGTELRRSRSGVPFSDRAADPEGEGVESGSPLPGDGETDHPEPMPESTPEPGGEAPVSIPRLGGGARKGRRLAKKSKPPQLTPQQRLLVLDTWRRSGLPAGDFSALIGISKHTLYGWKKRFEELGPAGLMDQPRGGPKGSKLPELTKRAILMLKESNPDWGCQRISDMLARGPALPASPAAVARVLHEHGYELEETPTKPHPPKAKRFERSQANQLWQTDLFTFMLKRQNRRVYLVAFMDDYSRFIVGYGLHASQTAAVVLEVLRSAIASHGTPEEILTDNGAQYVTWRGKSAFARELEKRGVKQIVATPRRPQTLGKIERFWGTMWRECIETAVFVDLDDARKRIGLFIDYYNFQRPHQGIDGLAPADRFFGAAPQVLESMKQRVASNALDLARNGTPKEPFYVTGNVGGKPFSLHAEGERVILSKDGVRTEVDLEAGRAVAVEPGEEAPPIPSPLCPDGSLPQTPGEPAASDKPAPGTSPLDDGLQRLAESLSGPENAESAPQGGGDDD